MRNRAPRGITLLAWNCWLGNSARNVHIALHAWIIAHQPDAILLSEARSHYDVIAGVAAAHGYAHHQEHPAPAVDGVVDERGDSAILVRDPDTILRRRVAVMSKLWRVLSKNRTHTPRRSEVAVLKINGQVWRLRADHFPTLGFKGPNRAAFLEQARRTRAWLLAARPGAASVSAGDLNEHATVLARWFGRLIRVFGSGIDVAACRGVRGGDVRELVGGNSDHNARLYRLYAR